MSVRVQRMRAATVPHGVIFAIVALGLMLAGTTTGLLQAPPTQTDLLTPPQFTVSVNAGATNLDQAMVAVTDEGTSTTLNLLRPSTAEAVASIQLGFYPMAVFRASKREILVSDVVLDSPSDPSRAHARLLVLDAANGLALRGVVPLTLPDRVRYTVYGQALVLSADQRLLYYLKHVDCGPGCDDMAVGIVDIDAQRETARAPLPRDCGYAQLTPAADGVVAMCPNQRSIWLVTSAGASTQAAAFDVADWPVAGGIGAGGDAYLITQNGKLVVQRQGQTSSREILAAGERFSGAQRWRLGAQRIALGRKVSNDELMTGIVELDTTSWTTSAYEVPTGTTFAANLGNGDLQLLHGDRLSSLDSASHLLRAVANPAPRHTEYLIGPGD